MWLLVHHAGDAAMSTTAVLQGSFGQHCYVMEPDMLRPSHQLSAVFVEVSDSHVHTQRQAAQPGACYDGQSALLHPQVPDDLLSS